MTLTVVYVGLKSFSEMLVQDIRGSLEEWIWWCDAELTDEQYARRKSMLLALLDETEQCAKEYMRGAPEHY